MGPWLVENLSSEPVAGAPSAPRSFRLSLMHVNEHFRGVTMSTLKNWGRFWSDPGRVAAAVAEGEFTLSATGTSDHEAKSFDPAYEVTIISAEIEARERLLGAAVGKPTEPPELELEQCFVQFTHPGGEHGCDAPGRKRWNVGEHKRKFLLGVGEYVDAPGARPGRGELVFWGEWEPESEVDAVAAPAVGNGPRWLHRPYYVRPATYWPGGEPLQNTDPFVFGDHFLYTLCRQTKSGHPTYLRDLAPGSVILFGSHKEGEFVLDTVFVTGEGVLHDSDTWRSVLADRVSETYDEVTLRPAYEGFGEHELRLYHGATLEKPVAGMFSFAPCLPAEVGWAGFARPSIRLSGVVNPELRMGSKRTPIPTPERLKRMWDAVVTQVIEQDLALGTRFDLPPRRDG